MVDVPEPRYGGVNRLWRVRTERGTFAVHLLLGLGRGADAEKRCQWVFDLELAASDAGVRIARPIAEPATGHASVRSGAQGRPVVVHEWVDAPHAHVDRSNPTFYRRLGSALARIHMLEVPLASPGGGFRSPSADDLRDVARRARRDGWSWARLIEEAADDFAAAWAIVDTWDEEGLDETVLGHRDLTSQNVLDLDGEPVLIDWEDAGTIGQGDEIGRTALDNLGRDGLLDGPKLERFLEGYNLISPVPAVGRHWCGLWVRGLILYADHCARSCLERVAEPSLLESQADVLHFVVPELRRRMALVDDLVDAFRAASPRERPGGGI